MTSQARIDANRHNAQLSTGPRTEEGKQASSRNATKHGFFARLLPIEEPAYRDMLTGLYRSLHPEDEFQQLLVDQIGFAYLRRMRMYHLIDVGDLLVRYETMLDRQIDRCLRRLWEAKRYRKELGEEADTDPPFLPAFGPPEPTEQATPDDPSEALPDVQADTQVQTAISPEQPCVPQESPLPLRPEPRYNPVSGRMEVPGDATGLASPAGPFNVHPLDEAARRLYRR